MLCRSSLYRGSLDSAVFFTSLSLCWHQGFSTLTGAISCGCPFPEKFTGQVSQRYPEVWLNILTGLGPEMPVEKENFGMNRREAAYHIQYLLINFVLLWLSALNRYSVDGLRRRKR